MKKHKKSAVDLTDLAIGVVILGIATAIGTSIVINLRNARTTEMPLVTVVNESVAAVSDTPVTLTSGWVSSVSSCVNTSNGLTVPAANYTVTTDNVNFGTATIKYSGVAGAYNGSDWSCTLTRYNISQADWDLANKSAIGLGEFGSWFKVIVIVGVAAVVLSLIFMAFGNRGSNTSVSY